MSDDKAHKNVVYPPGWQRRPSDSRERAAERRKRAAENRERDILRLRRLEEGHARGGKKGPVFRGLSDRIKAARANGEHVERARERGVSTGQIDEAFGGRSDRYRLAPGGGVSTQEAREKAARSLMQQARGYLRLAGAIAELTGENADDLKLEVVKGTNLWSSLDRPQGDDAGDERAERLDLLIHEMSRHVIRKAKPAGLFETLRQVPSAWSGRDGDGHEFVRRVYPCLSSRGFENGYSYTEEIEPLPGAWLDRLPAAELDVSVFPVERTEAGLSLGADGEAGAFSGTLRLYRDIRLVIGPTTSASNIGPMFESRPYYDLVPIDQDDDGDQMEYVFFQFNNWNLGLHLEFNSWEETFTDGDLAGGMAVVNDKDGMWSWASMRRETDDGGSWSEFYLRAPSKVRLIGEVCDPNASNVADFSSLRWQSCDESVREDDAFHHYQKHYCGNVAWMPVDAAHVAFLLDRPTNRYRSPSLYEPPEEQWFPAGTLAHDVENALATGELERALLDDIEDIRRALDKRREEWRANVEARDARLIAEWSADSTNGGADDTLEGE